MIGPSEPPWLDTLEALDAIQTDGPGRVVVTDPDQTDGLDLGQALRWALAGRTHTFAAIVGYFAHRGAKSDGSSRPELLSDPAKLVEAELADRSDHDSDDEEERPRFRLLYGALCSQESALALRAWYLVCRWRHGVDASNALAWRRRVLAALRNLSEPIDTFATKLFVDERSELRCPLLTSAADEWLPPELRPELVRWQAHHSMGDPVVASLFLYLLQRCAEVRFGRTQGSDVAPVRVFHPKLYVIERARSDAEPDTIVVAGSGNWSAPALSASNDGGSNVEMGVVFRSSGHAWSNPSRGSTGHELAAAGLAMYMHPRAQILASWTEPAHPSLEEAELALEVRTRAGQSTQASSPEAPVDAFADPSDLDETTLRIRLAIQRLIEKSLRLDPEQAQTMAAMLEHAEGAWGSKHPSGYQVDGAVRLLQILKNSRGAMLTDEPGLGKTLIAQLTVAALIKERIGERIRLPQGATVSPVRVTIVAPARVLGAGERRSDEPTQWFLYATEIRRAVRLLLAADEKLGVDTEEWTSSERLKIIPLSVSSFGRRIPADIDARKDIIKDLEHVAASDIAVLDEAHNFRNGTSRATRVLRFCLSLPACGEVGWRPRSGTEQEKETIGQKWLPQAGRKILLLTATPFNNDIGDIHAQVGHFAKAQAWDGLRKALGGKRKGKGRSKASQGRASVDLDLEQAINKRVEATPPLGDPYWESTEQRAHFETLVRLCAHASGDLKAHFESSRALDLNAESLTKQGEKGIDATARAASDTGPVYNWGVAEFSSELNTLFRVVADALERQGHMHDATETAEVEASARAKIDFFLSAFVVQRSRRQVIDELRRSATLMRDAKMMFRDPFEARRPRRLAISQSITERDIRDRAFLDSLYEVFKPASEIEDGTPRITLEAYRIRYMRGASAQQRSAGRVTNFLGFQAMTLIKRLQSSPYAFMRTLARGFVLTSLLELALVEELLERRGRATGQDFMSLLRPSASEVKHSRSKAAVAQAQQESFLYRVSRGLAVAKQRVMQTRFDVDEQDASDVIRLLRGESAGDVSKRAIYISVTSDHFFRALCSLDGTEPSASPHRREAFAHAVEVGEGLLEDGLQEEDPSWLGVLLRGVARVAESASDEAGILFDACQGLELLFGDADGQGLAVELYTGLQGVQGRDMASLVVAMTKKPPLHERDLATWVTRRLEDDERLACLVGFVLLHLHTAVARREAVGGDRALVFTEYGDTLEYIRAVLTALNVFGNYEPLRTARLPQWAAKLLNRLRTAVTGLAPGAGDVGDVVGGSGPFEQDDVARFASLSNDDLLALLRTFRSEVAVISANHGGGKRIGEVEPEPPQEDPEGDDEYDLKGESQRTEAAASTIGGAPILDAFSPFYQIDLPIVNGDAGNQEAAATRMERARKRLEAALANPVRVLLATEVLAEGVNLQQAGILIHYDLPWNPTRLIQRNGRIDRRINVDIEEQPKLEAYLRQLGLQDPGAAAASYIVPKRVFHFTVPPIEGTALDADAARERAQRVRAVLAAKLDNIRRILGLSSWPVVLDQKTASKVLDGSLEYETPSLVRRERLLQRVRELDASTAELRKTRKVDAGTITISISQSDLEHLARTITGEQANWSRLRALLLTTWSPRYPRSVPLRSAHEWSVALKREDESQDVGGMMPILVLDGNALTWFPHAYPMEGKSTKTTLLPVSWKYEQGEPLLVYVDPIDLTQSSRLSIPEAMTSPAALFDTTLDWLAELALSRGENLTNRCDISPPSTEQWGWLGPTLARRRPQIPGAEEGDVAAALRRPQDGPGEGTPSHASPIFSVDTLDSFNVVLVPA